MLTDRLCGASSGPIEAKWDAPGGATMRLMSVSDGPIEVTSAKSPGQPIPDQLGCLMLRLPGKSRRIATVLEPSKGAGSVTSVRLLEDGVAVGVKGGERVYRWE